MVSLKNVWVGDVYGQFYHVLKRHVRGLENELKSLADYLDLITGIGWDRTVGSQANLTVSKEQARTSGNFDTMRGIVECAQMRLINRWNLVILPPRNSSGEPENAS